MRKGMERAEGFAESSALVFTSYLTLIFYQKGFNFIGGYVTIFGKVTIF